MSHRDSLPMADGMLHRPRVHALIRQGLQQPLLVMLAGPGWGKTQAMADYLRNTESETLWLRLTKLDNIQSHFWDHLGATLATSFPNLAKQIQALDFPDTPLKQYAFFRLLDQSIAGQKQVIWVFDDFGAINDSKVMAFLKALAEIQLNAFHLVFISNAVTDVDSVAFFARRRALILAKDLQFTKDEIAELYDMYGIPLTPEELDEITHYTEGWPLPLHLLVMQRGKISDLVLEDGTLNPNAVSHMLEENFSAHTEAIQKLSLKLSLLHSFTFDLAIDLYDGEKSDLEGQRYEAFLSSEPATGRLSFHNLYQLFLQTRQSVLHDNEKRRVWARAAEYYLKHGHYFDAIGYYRKCGDHAGMLNAIRDFIRTQDDAKATSISLENADFFLEHLDLLTPDEVRQYPIADYFRALVYLNRMELGKAEALFLDLERRLLCTGTPEDLSLLGEVYALHGGLQMMRNQEDFGDYYKKAAEYLPDGTNLLSTNGLLTKDSNVFCMQDHAPGALERMECAVHDGMPWVNKVLKGGMSGREHLYSAEAAYLTGRFDDVKQHAYRTIYKAEQNAQHDLICHSYGKLARTALMQGDFAEMKANILNMEEYVGRQSFGALDGIRDTLLGWYYTKLRDFQEVPQSLLAQKRSGRAVLSYGREIIVYANYLINTKEYAKMVSLLEYPVGLYLTSGIWQDRISLYIMLAIGYAHLDNHPAAMDALWSAYEMTYHNGLTTLFIEADRHMLHLVEIARRQQIYEFDPAWLDLLAQEAATFSRRATAVRAAYREETPEALAVDNPLTKREIEVLQALALGLTREEIASAQSVSVNTVKSIIRNVYNKLDATNRAEAVSISISRGYIEPPVA